MSTTHGQPGLSSEQRSTIRSTILSARNTLESEIRRQLERYGVYEDERLPLEELSHLSLEDRHTRRTIDAALERELESTDGDLERSITNYVREATKAYLNRFVALKCIEVRGLVEETITERPEYGNRSYMHYTVAEIAGELTSAPDDGFGAALDLAYQEIGAEIRMIFEESEHTVIDLDAQVRGDVLDELGAIDDEAWESDEALGWVYQYFGEKEREEIDDRVDEENYKIAGTDIATKTQLFTPRYIVEWMVDNSLGRTWLEMQGERTNIDDEENCFYLAPLEDSLLDRETKSVKDITVLDPACGSGHMLFYAFDVLYQMYLEEGEIPEEYIPREILQNNLYGIDIDSGAAQIAALSLYLKAKEQSPEVTVPQLNIASADAVLINGNRKQEVLERARSDLEEKILEQIWRSFDNIREFGSLVRVEERIDEILENHKDAIQESGQVKFTQEGSFATQSSFVSREGEEESWEQVKARLLEEVGKLTSEALDRDDPIEEMFAGEVGKTVELMDLLIYEYDVVVSNPPYLSSQKMGDNLKDFLKDNYSSYRNSYTCFIERCLDLSKSAGYSTLVTPEDFMTLKSYKGIRDIIIGKNQFIEGLHLSRYGFDQQKDSYTIPFVLRNSPREFQTTRFFRLTHEQEEYENFEKKIEGLHSVIDLLRDGGEHEDVYVVNTENFRKIGSNTFVYWFGQEVLSLFDEFDTLDQYAEARSGIVTGDNDHHLRKIWEIPDTHDECNYELWVSNGRDIDYYDYVDTLVRWKNNGDNIVNYAEKHGKNIQGFSDMSNYFNTGVVFRDFSSDFTAKLLRNDCLHSKKAYFIDINENKLHYLLGYLNSWLNRFIMQGLNPGLNFNPGDVENIPFNPDPSSIDEINRWVEFCIDQRKKQHILEDKAEEFDHNKLVSEYNTQLFYTESRRANVEIANDIVSNIIFDVYGISEKSQRRIRQSTSGDLSKYPYISVDGCELPSIFDSYVNAVQDQQKREQCRSYIAENIDEDIIDISHDLSVSPHTVVQLKYEGDLYSEDEMQKCAGRLVSTLLGYHFGRFNRDSEKPSEILDISRTSNSDWKGLVASADSLFPSYSDLQEEIESLVGKDIHSWISNRYFRYNHCKEYKRRGQRNPLYWQLESPDGAFSCFIYYHEISSNTLPKLRGQYLDPRIGELENELETLNSQTNGKNPDKELLNRKEEVQNDLDDIRRFRDTIDEMIDDGVTVDVEKGIWENIKEWDQYEVLETGLPKLKSSYSR